MHIPGSGDYQIASITPLGDPCPIPSKSSDEKQKRISKKQKMLYAPMSDINDMVSILLLLISSIFLILGNFIKIYDKDAIYIDIRKDQLNFTEGEGIV